MNRFTFLKLSSALAAVPLASLHGCAEPGEKLSNWAGNFEYSTTNVDYPKTVQEVQELVKKYSKLKALGTRHCFNRIADSNDHLVSTKEMNKVVSLDADALTVTVEAGTKYGELCPYLDAKGYSLHNLASLPHISVAGSCATATHGSGVANGNLSSAVTGMEIVKADGSLVQLERTKDGDQFLGAVVNLGALGVVTKMSLALQPSFKMRQHVFERMPMAELEPNFNQVMSAGYSVSLFTDWAADNINEVWIKSRVDGGENYDGVKDFFGATAATKDMHPIAELSAENCTPQMGVEGPWFERMPHFKMGFTPSSGKELQAEYFVPFDRAIDAIKAVAKMGKEISPHLFISEIRSIAADDLWMSPCRNQPSIAIHFTWKQDWPNVSRLLPEIEKALEPYNGKPHWGKLFTISPEKLASRYDMMPAFKDMMKAYDPDGKFRNDFLNTSVFGS